MELQVLTAGWDKCCRHVAMTESGPGQRGILTRLVNASGRNPEWRVQVDTAGWLAREQEESERAAGQAVRALGLLEAGRLEELKSGGQGGRSGRRGSMSAIIASGAARSAMLPRPSHGSA